MQGEDFCAVTCLSIQYFLLGILPHFLVSLGVFGSKQIALIQMFVELNSREKNARAQTFCLRKVKLPFDIFPLKKWYLFNRLPD